MAKLDPIIQRKIMRYCAYQERCTHEVEHKLHTLGCPPNKISAYIRYLSAEDFLKEARYAEVFVRGKVNNNKWGPRKIEMALTAKKVDPTLIQKELAQFDTQWPELEAYWSARMTKAWAHKSYDDYTLKGKLRTFLRQKGFFV